MRSHIRVCRQQTFMVLTLSCLLPIFLFRLPWFPSPFPKTSLLLSCPPSFLSLINFASDSAGKKIPHLTFEAWLHLSNRRAPSSGHSSATYKTPCQFFPWLKYTYFPCPLPRPFTRWKAHAWAASAAPLPWVAVQVLVWYPPWILQLNHMASLCSLPEESPYGFLQGLT